MRKRARGNHGGDKAQEEREKKEDLKKEEEVFSF